MQLQSLEVREPGDYEGAFQAAERGRADLPMQQPTAFELTVNVKRAKELGITVPATVIARADKVID